jgi:hypothetical protein
VLRLEGILLEDIQNSEKAGDQRGYTSKDQDQSSKARTSANILAHGCDRVPGCHG